MGYYTKVYNKLLNLIQKGREKITTVKKPTYKFETTTPTVVSYTSGKEKVVKTSKTISGKVSTSPSKALESLRQAEKTSSSSRGRTQQIQPQPQQIQPQPQQIQPQQKETSNNLAFQNQQQKNLAIGGYYVSPTTRLGYSSKYDLSKEGYIRTATMRDIQSGELYRGNDGVIYGKEGIKEYNTEVERIKNVLPKEQYLNPSTGERYDIKQIVYIGKHKFTNTPIKIYVNPKTNEPIENINEYIIKNKIPIPTDTSIQEKRKTIISSDEFIKRITENEMNTVYDIETLKATGRQFTLKIGKHKIMYNVSGKYSGEVIPLVDTNSITDLLSTALISTYFVRGGLFAVGKFGASYITGTALIEAEKKLIPQPKSTALRFLKSGIEGYTLVRYRKKLPAFITSSISTKFTTDISLSLAERPVETIKTITTSPETYGFIVGGGLAGFQEYMFDRRPIEIKYKELELTKNQQKILGEIYPEKPTRINFIKYQNPEFNKIVQRFNQLGEKVIIKQGKQTMFISRFEELKLAFSKPETITLKGYLGNPYGGNVFVTIPKNIKTITDIFGLKRGNIIELKQSRQQALISYNKQLNKLINSGYSEYKARNILRFVRPKKIKYKLQTKAEVIQGLDYEKINIYGTQKQIPIKELTTGYGKGLLNYETLITSGGKKQTLKVIENLVKVKTNILKDSDLKIPKEQYSLYRGTKRIISNKGFKDLNVGYLVKTKSKFRIPLFDEKSTAFLQEERLLQKSFTQQLGKKISFLDRSESKLITAQPFRFVNVVKQTDKDLGIKEVYILRPERFTKAQPFPNSVDFLKSYKKVMEKNINFLKNSYSGGVVLKDFKTPTKILFISNEGLVDMVNLGSKLKKIEPTTKIIRRMKNFEALEKTDIKQSGKLLKGSGMSSREFKMIQELSHDTSNIPLSNIYYTEQGLTSLSSNIKTTSNFNNLYLAPEIITKLKTEKSQKTEPLIKLNVQPKLKIEPQIRVEPKIKPKLRIEPKIKPKLRVEPKVRAEPKLRVEPQIRVEPQLRVEPKVRAEPKIRIEPQLRIEPTLFIGQTITRNKPTNSFLSPLNNNNKKIKRIKTYSVYEKRFGEFRKIGSGLTFGEAIRKGERRVLTTLGRTFKIKETGFREGGIDEIIEDVEPIKFRKYKIRKGKKIPLKRTYIQKAKFALSNIGEKEEIQLAKRRSMEIKKLMNF